MTGEVSPVSDPGQLGAGGELRASDSDRDRVVETLRVAAGDGRLTPAELDERLEEALTARTYSQLASLTTDLPAWPDPAGQAMPLAASEAKQLVRIDCGSGRAGRDGQWIVPQRMEVRVRSGRVRLDFTQAAITGPTLEVDADVGSGSLVLITRPGIVVDADDVAVRSGSAGVRTHRNANAPVILRVLITGKVASGALKARPPRRTLLQWLLRRPSAYA